MLAVLLCATPTFAAEVTIDGTILDAIDEYSASPGTVFTDANTGYAFFVDSTGDVSVASTTDGGASWTVAFPLHGVSPAVTWNNVAVWYDQWTPGDDTGTTIHIAAINETDDDLYYTSYDVATNAATSSGWTVIIAGTNFGPASDGAPSITKSTDGFLFASGHGNFGANSTRVYKSINGGLAWSNTSLTMTGGVADTDFSQLLPLPGGDVLLIHQDISEDDIDSKEYDEATDAWTNEQEIDTFTEVATYDVTWAATLYRADNTIYLAGSQEVGTDRNDIQFYSFDPGSRTWTTRQNVSTDSYYALQAIPIVDQTTGYVYVPYLYGLINSDTYVYYKMTTNGGVNWSYRSTAVSTTLDDMKNIRSNLMSPSGTSKMYVLWYNDDTNIVYGNTIDASITTQQVPNQTVIDPVIFDATDEYNASPAAVYTSTTTLYVFYVDSIASTGDLRYIKSSDGGDTFAAPVDIETTVTSWANVAVWYDQWTAGDTGTRIHIAATADTAVDDTTHYTYLDTASDTLRGGGVVTIGGAGARSINADTGPSITKATDGTVFVSFVDGTSALTIVSTSTDSGATWGNTTLSTDTTVDAQDVDFSQLFALTGGDVLLVFHDISGTDLRSVEFDSGTYTWGNELIATTTFTANATYDTQFGGATNPLTDDIYVVGSTNVTNAANDLAAFKFDESSRTWSALTDVVTNDAGMTQGTVVIDSATGHLYALYTDGTLATTMDVFAKISTDDGSTWSNPIQLSSWSDDIKNVRGTFRSNQRLAAIWYNDDANDMVMNQVGMTRFDQASYRWFENLDAVSPGMPLAAQSTSATLASDGAQFRLRMLLSVDYAPTPASLWTFKLQYAERSGTCDAAFSGETYADVETGSGDIRFYNNTTPADGATLAATTTDPLNGGETISYQTYEESNNFTNSVESVFSNRSALFDFSLAEHANSQKIFCFRVVRSNGSQIWTYTVVPEITTAVPPNSLPVASAVSLDSGAASVTLTEGTTRNTVCAGTITDTDGFADIQAVGSWFFRTSTGTSSPPDANERYYAYGDSQCVPSGGSGSTETYTCTFAVQYYADPTDAGSPHSSDNWTCELWPEDDIATGTPATDTIEMASLIALDVTSTINYGTVNANADTGVTNQTTTITNTGNRDMDPELSGIAMTDGGSGSIAAAQQKYSATGFTYSSGGTALSTSPTAFDLTLPQRTGSEVTDDVLWGLGVPNATPQGSYTGTNTFTATTGI